MTLTLERFLSWFRDGVFDSLYTIVGSFVAILSVFAILMSRNPLDILRDWLTALVVPQGWVDSVAGLLANGTPWGVIGMILAGAGAFGMGRHGIMRGRSGPTFWFGAGLMLATGTNWLWLIAFVLVGFVLALLEAGELDMDLFGNLVMTLVLTPFYAPFKVLDWLTGETPGSTRQQIVTPYGQPLKIQVVPHKESEPTGSSEAHRRGHLRADIETAMIDPPLRNPRAADLDQDDDE